MIIVFAEQRDGVLKKAAKEALSEGRRLKAKLNLPVAGVLVGAKATEALDEAKQYGPDKLFTVDGIDNYSPDAYAAAVADIVRENNGTVVLFPASAMGTDVAPRLTAAVKGGLVTDITALTVDGDQLKAVKPVYSGKALATMSFNSDVAVVSLRTNVFPAEENAGDPEVVSVDGSRYEAKAVAAETEMKAGGKVELKEAAIIVSGGRGLKGPENFPMLQELTDMLGGALGASRAAVDAGWIDHSHQVGQTGKVVSPKVYIACGISGAIQHLAGMGSSKYIIAINKDEDAPIFNLASLGVVGDLFKVVPALKEELKKHL